MAISSLPEVRHVGDDRFVVKATHAIEGQLRRAESSNVVQESPELAKLISGAPPSPLMTSKKASWIT